MSNEWIATVSTAFSDADIHIRHMTASEELGRPFRCEVELLCDEIDLSLDQQLGQSLTVEFKTREAIRYFNGLVSQISFDGMVGQKARYVAVLHPWLWFLKHCSDNRVFQNKSVPEIVKDVFRLHGNSCSDSLTESYRPRDYCVQYGESDFDFVSRLMEEEGIYYFFKHKDGEHDMVLADSSSAHSPFEGYSAVQFFPPSRGQREEDHISDWGLSHRVETQVFTLSSYDYEKPKANLLAENRIEQDHGQANKEQYEYGQLYREKADGTALSQVRIEEQQVGYEIATGGGNVRGLCCGSQFKLTNYPRNDQNKKYLVISANYQLQNSETETGRGSSEASFICFFSALDEKTPYRAARSTTKALVRGPQTAVIVGPDGEEIWTDKYGRVKIQFHWDRQGKKDENSSCWVRVAHAWAGQKWGFVSIPRIGQEVIVDFLEGDPDQPIITGSVYNDTNMPPYGLPDNQTQSGIKSRSSKKGGPKNFNELRFEDKKGSEQVYFHAETDFLRVVENNDTLQVGLSKKDKGDQTIEIHNDRTATLKEGNDLLTIEKGDQTVKIDKGNQIIDVKKKIKITAGDEFVVTVGQSKLTMKKNGDIKIEGVKIDIAAMNSVTIDGKAKVSASGAQIQIAGSVKTEVKAAMTKIEGSGMLDLKAGGMAKLKGGITMIG